MPFVNLEEATGVYGLAFPDACAGNLQWVLGKPTDPDLEAFMFGRGTGKC
jgi:hypothetical protein